ncbi:yggt family protein [Roseibium sp. TrichSKD4]|nr:yggt family protein [Roseibium sp. TrichSKD4]
MEEKKNGGAKGNRTPDLFAASEALSQLSYGPVPLLKPAWVSGADGGGTYPCRLH